MASETVNSCIEDIKKNLTQKGSSKKDEARVMKAMLSDTSYRVGVYGKDGLESEYCPAEDYKNMCAEIIADAIETLKEQDKEIKMLKLMGLKIPEILCLSDEKPIYKE